MKINRLLFRIIFLCACLAFMCFAPVSHAAVTVNIVLPSLNTFSGQAFIIAATASSSYEITSVTAAVEGKSTSLTYSGTAIPSKYGGSPGWTGIIDLRSLTEGLKTLTVTAVDAGGGTGSKTATFTYDNKPVISITSPLDESVATPAIRIKASCADTVGNCTNIKVSLNSTQLASGTTNIDQEISLANYNGQKVALLFEGIDSVGQKTTLTRNVSVEASGRLTKIADLPGVVWDYVAAGRMLYLDTSNGGHALKIKNTGGTIITAFDQAGKIPQYGFLTPRGSIFMEQSGNVLTSSLHDWNNGSLIDLGYPNSAQSLVTKGNYAIWCEQPNLILRDLSSGTNTIISTNAGNWMNDLTSNGDVVYWDMSYQINRYRNGASAKLTNDINRNVYPLTDGLNVAYRTNTSNTSEYGIGLYTTSGVAILSPPRASGSSPGRDYQVNNGWVAYTKPGTTNQLQIWLRATDGTAEQATFFSTSSQIVALSPTGELFISNGGKLYSYLKAQGLVEISSTIVKPLYVGNKWYGIVGRSIFSIDTTADTSAPLIKDFVIPAMSTSFAVPITTFLATDNAVVTGYMLTETATVPLATAIGWSAAVPTSYIFTTSGTKILYAWAKDAAGNVSAAKSGTIIIAHDYNLAVSKDGTGSGTVTSSPSGIDCGSACNADYLTNSIVTLTASAAAFSTFAGWSGSGCSGTDPCTVTMDAGKTIIATFTLDTTSPVGSVKINDGLEYTNSRNITLNLSATDLQGITEMSFSNDGKEWTFPEPYAVTKPWILPSGDGTKTIYVKFKDAAGNWSDAYSAMITYDSTLPTQFLLTIATTGAGQGTVFATGITCNGVTCTGKYNSGAQVVLSAVATAGSFFAGWGGDCSGLGNCTLTMDAIQNATAAFSILGPITGKISTDVTGQTTSVSSAKASILGTTFSATADSNGNFILANLPTGNYTLVISAPNFIPVSQQINYTGAGLQLSIPSLKTYSPGDANGNGQLGIEDAIFILQTVSGMRSE